MLDPLTHAVRKDLVDEGRIVHEVCTTTTTTRDGKGVDTFVIGRGRERKREEAGENTTLNPSICLSHL